MLAAALQSRAMLRATIDDVRMDTRLQLLHRYELFQLVLTCDCGHVGVFDLAGIRDWRITARVVIERGRCLGCGQRGGVRQLTLEHAGWKHQPVAWRVLWRDGAAVIERARLRGTPAQLEAAERDANYAERRVHRDIAPPSD